MGGLSERVKLKLFMSKATELTNEIIHQFYIDGAYAWRASSVGVYDKAKGQFRTAPKKGVSDILACYKGTLIAVEIKIGSDRLSAEQVGFQRNIMHAGGEAFTTKSFVAFLEWWLETQKKLSTD